MSNKLVACVVGEQGSGKSTFCGALLSQMGCFMEREISRVESQYREAGGQQSSLGWLVERRKQDRDLKTTVRNNFYNFSISSTIECDIIDTPGNFKFWHRGLCGLHICDVVIVVVDSRRNLETESAQLLTTLKAALLYGVQQIIVAITHMDVDSDYNTVDAWDEQRYTQVKSYVSSCIQNAGFSVETSVLGFVPVSPFAKGDYLTLGMSKHTSHWQTRPSESFVHVCNCVKPRERVKTGPSIAFIHESMRISGIGTVCTAIVVRGCFARGDATVFPLHQQKQIFTFENFHRSIDTAPAGSLVGINVRRATVSEMRKQFLLSPGASIEHTSTFTCDILLESDTTKPLLFSNWAIVTPFQTSNGHIVRIFGLVSSDSSTVTTLYTEGMTFKRGDRVRVGFVAASDLFLARRSATPEMSPVLVFDREDRKKLFASGTVVDVGQGASRWWSVSIGSILDARSQGMPEPRLSIRTMSFPATAAAIVAGAPPNMIVIDSREDACKSPDFCKKVIEVVAKGSTAVIVGREETDCGDLLHAFGLQWREAQSLKQRYRMNRAYNVDAAAGKRRFEKTQEMRRLLLLVRFELGDRFKMAKSSDQPRSETPVDWSKAEHGSDLIPSDVWPQIIKAATANELSAPFKLALVSKSLNRMTKKLGGADAIRKLVQRVPVEFAAATVEQARSLLALPESEREKYIFSRYLDAAADTAFNGPAGFVSSYHQNDESDLSIHISNQHKFDECGGRIIVSGKQHKRPLVVHIPRTTSRAGQFFFLAAPLKLEQAFWDNVILEAAAVASE